MTSDASIKSTRQASVILKVEPILTRFANFIILGVAVRNHWYLTVSVLIESHAFLAKITSRGWAIWVTIDAASLCASLASSSDCIKRIPIFTGLTFDAGRRFPGKTLTSIKYWSIEVAFSCCRVKGKPSSTMCAEVRLETVSNIGLAACAARSQGSTVKTYSLVVVEGISSHTCLAFKRIIFIDFLTEINA